jgi:hypothetical protein
MIKISQLELPDPPVLYWMYLVGLNLCSEKTEVAVAVAVASAVKSFLFPMNFHARNKQGSRRAG